MQRLIDGVDPGLARGVGAEQGGHAPGAGGRVLGLQEQGLRLGDVTHLLAELAEDGPDRLREALGEGS